jgi:hypothetical protein
MGRNRARRLVLATAALAAVVAVPATANDAAAPAPGDAQPPSLSTPSSHFAPALSRIVSTRVWHTRLSTVRNSNARRIGRSLAGLHPTWVSGLLRYRRNQYPNRRETRTWREIRRVVRSRNHGAQFDVVLNAMQYRTPAAITKTMRRIRHKLDNDGWFFDFFSSAFRKHPKMIRAAIHSAHKHGEWIGGNVFGLAGKAPKLPARADFLSVQDNNAFHLNLKAVKRLSRRHTVTYHLHNDPDKQRGGGCRFIEGLTSQERRRLIKRRAAQGDRRGFRMSYPVLFPECLRARPNAPGSFLYSYNAFRDPPVARTIRNLLDRYDFKS